MRFKRTLYAISTAGCLAVGSSIVAQEIKINKTPVTYVDPLEGATVYQTFCASCHGATGKGDGPAAPALKTAATNLTKMAANNDGVYPSRAVLLTLRHGGGAHGDAGMPVWGTIFRQSWGESDMNMRVYNLVRYLESIQDPPPVKRAKQPKQLELRITDVRPHFGGEMYRAYCSSCHGVDGKGQGPSAYTLKKTPTDLTALRGPDGKFPIMKIQNLLEQPAVAAHGSTEMPIWGDLFRKSHEDEALVRLRVHNLARYLESMQR